MIAYGGHQLIAIHDLAMFVGQDQAVCVTVQGNAYIGALGDHLFTQKFGVG
jgi:hypothetical protein